MTRKHFVALADALRTLPAGETRDDAVAAVAVACRRSNPRFDSRRFALAAGYGELPTAAAQLPAAAE